MGTVATAGFAPLPVDRLRDLLDLESLSDLDMARELDAARLDPGAPSPSVESLLTPSCLTGRFSTLMPTRSSPDQRRPGRSFETCSPTTSSRSRIKPGFDLARLVRSMWADQAHPGVTGMVLMNHGLFTFGEDDRIAYERHVELIDRAERWLDDKAPRSLGPSGAPGNRRNRRAALPTLWRWPAFVGRSRPRPVAR